MARFHGHKKRGAEVGYGRKGKGTTIMLMVDGEGVPLSAFTTAATTSEVHAIETLVDERVCDKVPERLLYDKAADADWLREALDVCGIGLICPHPFGSVDRCSNRLTVTEGSQHLTL